MIVENSSGSTCVSVVTHQGKLLTFFEKQDPSGKGVLRVSISDPATDAPPGDSIALTYPDEIRTAGMSLLTLPDNAVPDALDIPGRWQVLSDNAYIYLFRALPTTGNAGVRHVLCANRYILVPQRDESREDRAGSEDDPVTYRLEQKTEARYRQTRQRETPGNATDKPDFLDLDGVFFREPVVLFPGIEPLEGRFCVTLLPTDQAPTLRWLIFAAGERDDPEKTPIVSYYSFPRDAYGWVDFEADRGTGKALDGDFAPVERGTDKALTLVGMPSCRMFRRQETTPGTAPDTLTGPRVALSGRFLVENDQDGSVEKLVVMDFELADDGSPLIDTPEDGRLRISRVQPAQTALSFDGDRDRVEIPAEVPQTVEDLTVEAWIRTEGGSAALITRTKTKGSTEPGFALYLDGDTGQLVATFVLHAPKAKSGAAHIEPLKVTAPAPSSHQWHQIVAQLVFVGGKAPKRKYQARLYEDGVLRSSKDYEFSSEDRLDLNARGETYLGYDPEGVRPDLAGGMDEVRMWSSARSREDIRELMYRELTTGDIQDKHLVGYWKFNDAFSDAPHVARDAKGRNNGRVRGARWTTDTAPVSPPEGPSVPPTLDGFSSDMGILDFVSGEKLSDPLLEDGADGRLHLYFAAGEAEATDLALKVLHYDTAVNRARYSLPWTTGGAVPEEGSLVLAAIAAGPVLNLRPKDGEVIEVAAVDGAEEALLDLTFTTSTGAREVFHAVPADVERFSQVVNGQASDDPLDLRVRTGEVPFYDYTGTRPAIDIATTEGAPLRVVTARNAAYPSALPVAGGALRSGSGGKPAGKRTLAVSLRAIDSRVKDSDTHKTKTIRRDLKPVLEIAGLPEDGPGAFAVLDGVVPADVELKSAELAGISAGAAPIYVVYAPARPVSLTTKPVPGQPTRLEVTVTVETDGKQTSAIWTGVSDDPAAFMAALNLQDGGSATPAQIEVAHHFVLVGANNTAAVRGHSMVMEAPDRIAAFVNAIGVGVAGEITTKGKFDLAPKEELTRKGLAETSQRGSLLFAATDTHEPANGRSARIRPASGQLRSAGNFGGWIPSPPTTSGDFSVSAASLGQSKRQSLLLNLPGDFTFEAWTRPQDLSKPQRLITANRSGGSAYTVGLREVPTYSVYMTDKQRGRVDVASGLTGAAQVTMCFWWLGEPVPKAGQNNASIQIYNSDRKEWFVLGRIRTDHGDVWEGLYVNPSLPKPDQRVPLLLEGGQEPVAPRTWYFVSLEIDFDAKSASLHWRPVSGKTFENGRFAGDVKFRNRNLKQIVVGRPTEIVPGGQTFGTTQRVAELSIWDTKLENAERERLFRAPPIRNAAGLRYAFNVPADYNELKLRHLQNTALYGPSTPFEYDEETSRGEGPRPTRRLFAGAGARFAEASVPMAPDTWSHIAVACSDNDALAFDGTQFCVARESKSLSFGEQLSIDGRIRFDGLPRGATESVILSKSDNTETDTSYMLSCNAAGAVSLTVFLDNESRHRYTPPEIVLPKGKPAYLAISAKVVLVEPDCFKFSYTAENGSGTAFSDAVHETKLVFQAFLRTDDAIVQPKPREVVLHRGSTSQAFELRRSRPEVTVGARAAVPSPRDPDADRAFFLGVMGGLRLWSFDISRHFTALSESSGVPEALADGLEADWPMDEANGLVAKDVAAGHDLDLPSSDRMWRKARITSALAFYIDDQPIASDLVTEAEVGGSYGDENQLTLGALCEKGKVQQAFDGQMDDIRLWSAARSSQEVIDNMHTELSGGEAELAAYWPVEIGSGSLIKDRTGRGGTLELSDPAKEDDFWWQPGGRNESPIGNEAPQIDNALHGPKSAWHVLDARSASATAEYGALSSDDARDTQLLQYRGYAYLAPDPEDATKNVVRLIPGFRVGEADLTYIGQAQTAPTILGYIEGAPPVPRENLTRPYYTSAARYQAYTGITGVRLTEADDVTYTYSAAYDTGANFSSEFGFGLSYSTGTSFVTAPVGIGVDVKGPDLSGKLGGTAGVGASFGYLNQSTRTIGTDRSRATEITLSGNWAAAPEPGKAERFYDPDNTGAALVKSASANVFALRLKTTGALSGIVMTPDPSIARDFNIILFPINPLYTKQGTLDGMQGFQTSPGYPEANVMRGSYFKPREAMDLEQQIEVVEASLRGDYTAFDTARLGVMPVGDPQGVLDDELIATADFATGQSRRNLVNTFVWTAGGGLLIESMKSLASRTEVLGGNYSFNIAGGISGGFEVSLAPLPIGAYGDGKVLLGGHLQSNANKTEAESLGFSMDVTNDTEPFLATWLYDCPEPSDGGAAAPGKVSGFRFKSFYLAPAASAFDDFFSTVVDPNWLLTSDDAAASALRQARGSRNSVWRVKHRVTHVERVPPRFNQTPQDTAERPGRTLVDTVQNSLLMQLVAERLSHGSEPLPERVTRAVVATLAPDGPVAARVPWWNALITDAQGNVTGPAASALNDVSEAIRSYALAYFERSIVDP